MTKEKLLMLWEWLESGVVLAEDWFILILNESIEEDWIIPLMKGDIDKKDIPLKGESFFVIVKQISSTGLIDNWKLSENEVKKFLELADLLDWCYDVCKGILLLYADYGIMTEVLMRFIEYLIKERYTTKKA